MIVVFNAVAWGFEHVPFDAAFLATTAEAYPGEPIHFFAEKDHLGQTQRFLDSRRALPGVEWRELVLPPRLAPPRARWRDDLRVCRQVLSEAQRLGAERVIACYLHAITGTLALKALRLLHRKSSLALIHHSGVMKLASSRRLHPLLELGNRRLRQLVLGDAIRAEVIGQFPGMAGTLHAIRHPYFFEEASPSELPLPADGPITFSFVGLIDETKGFPGFVELAGALAPAWDGAVRFDLIGGKREGVTPAMTGPHVTAYAHDGPLAREVFEQKLGETAYTVFPYDPEYYRLVASGSVLDALAAGKPIIALRNPQFDEMFQVMGDIGYLCDDVAGIKRTIEAILREPPRARYAQQSRNTLSARRLFEPAQVATQLRAALA